MPDARFRRYWAGAAISSFGTAVTSVAMPVLVVQQLRASAIEVGLVNAAQLVPYAVLGLVAGVFVDRWPRRPVLVWSSVGRAVALAVLPVLWATGTLRPWQLVLALLVFGSFSVFGFAATQSLLPRLVPRIALVRANARLDQTDAAAQTAGPALGGIVVGLLGAPVALVLDAMSYLVEALLIARLRVDEPPVHRTSRHLGTELAEGLRFTYTHSVLARLAFSTHLWFLANGAAMTTLSLLTLRTLGFSAAGFGLAMAGFGVSSLVGASLAPAAGRRLGAGRVIVLSRWLYAAGWALPLAAERAITGRWIVVVALVVLGLAAGIVNANEMGLWQSLTPDRLMGRVNASRRSVNRTAGAAGAALGGVCVTAGGEGPTLVAAVALFLTAALVSLPTRRHDLAQAGEPHEVGGNF